MRIRKLFCFDYPKIKKMISYLDTDDYYTKNIMSDTVGILNYILPSYIFYYALIYFYYQIYFKSR